MERLEISGAVRLIYKSLGVKGLNTGNVDFSLHTVHKLQNATSSQ